ncbi:ferrous iron transport protein B [Flavilitoribacter nigricans]|uniref:Ferrous iron transport protein B n=1 Tax=Flavilitoribacter nigricans (strain ATCC 23147 / DSM 23189 / NBRC 102662 / NCIMB 1420 / SS-2) TaxID=1122177 RepID=A0A2D0NBB8_FLAN2|nr:ferrous iron transport protein B [Flavilitoribacter nigricans]PHN05812.1 ferrous iron transport protein B [Flavilitoribacter nigricans DSM 23189 = NBRC 102662]
MVKEHNTQATTKTVALLGNPNCGKSSLFNQLTGLSQKVGNFPGVTVDKKYGAIRLTSEEEVGIVDFPGTYSFYPTALDERIVVQSLLDPESENHPDAILYVADITKLEKHLLLFSQLKDLGLPLALVLNMSDIAEKEGLQLDQQQLASQLGVPVVVVSSRTGEGMNKMISLIENLLNLKQNPPSDYDLPNEVRELTREIQNLIPNLNDYQALLIAHHHNWLPFLETSQKKAVARLVEQYEFKTLREQVDETMSRFDSFSPLVKRTLTHHTPESNDFSNKLDRVLTHRIFGPVIFFLLMLLVFQAIYAWAAYPMDAIDWLFGLIGDGIQQTLPDGWLSSLLVDGLLAGLGGIVVFVPQIAILFFLISILEEVGYMARAAFMFDRLMQVFGLNGRSIVALISGGACAIPAVMSTRTISNWKERLITILVTPFISCSARIPVYTVLIGFAVPATTVGGIFNLQGLAFMALYLFGIAAALLAALVFKWILKTREHSFLMLEMPEYRLPVMRNIWINVWEKVKTFLMEAGKVILAISLVLWIMASFAPSGAMDAAEQEALAVAEAQALDEQATENLIAAKKIETSYAGRLGKAIEPVIRPLGFDWKIGIALITSFAAREVFVGTMATIYSIGSDSDENSVRAKMATEINPETGEKVYNRATSWSLLLFYVFAMMCMSTLAVVKRETKSWKWPVIQFVFMTGLAYLTSFLAYQWLS